MSDPDRTAQPEPATREDLETGLRFSHLVAVQERNNHYRTADEIAAVVDLLIARGVFSHRDFEARRDELGAGRGAPAPTELVPLLGTTPDKHRVISPDVPCSELLPTCHAACCGLNVHLSTQDLDEGILRWDYAMPYRLRRRATDRLCVHCDPIERTCAVRDTRPAPCRSYDCRKDSRIWEDYERRIPSENVRRLAPAPHSPPD